MKDSSKTKQALIEELVFTRQRISELEQSEIDRKKAEEALRESEIKYRELVNFLPISVYEMDLQGNVISGNPEIFKTFGYEPSDLEKGLNALQGLIGPDDFDRACEVALRIFKGERTGGTEYTGVRKDGSTFPFLNVASPIIRGNEPVGLRGAIFDLTKQKQAKEELKRALENLRKSFGTIIRVMVSAVESRDPYTAGHQLRSADLARAIATEMGLSREEIEGIRMAGSIHDIGKLSIPSEILSKSKKLSKIEFLLIKEHAQQGYEILKDVESPWPLAEIVYQHHERINGSGYPRALKGEEILIEARILAVADVVEAMASHRPYRPALGIEAALDHIAKNKNILFESRVVDACIRLFSEKRYQFRQS